MLFVQNSTPSSQSPDDMFLYVRVGLVSSCFRHVARCRLRLQNEKELIRLASAGVGGIFCISVGSINLAALT